MLARHSATLMEVETNFTFIRLMAELADPKSGFNKFPQVTGNSHSMLEYNRWTQSKIRRKYSDAHTLCYAASCDPILSSYATVGKKR